MINNKLWKDFISGESHAFQQLYTSYFEELYAYSFKIYPNEDFAKDCVQDIFVKLYERRSFLSKPKNIRNYLYKSTRNCVYRKLERERKYDELETNNSELPRSSSKYIIQNETIHVENSEQINEILSALIQNLSKKQQEILYLKFAQGFDYKEIGELLEIDPSSVRKQVYRIIKKIRNSTAFSKSKSLLILAFFYR